MITTRDPKRAMKELRHGETVTLEVPRHMVPEYERTLDAGLPPNARARIRVRGSEAAERKGCIALRTTRKGIQVGLYHSEESELESEESLPYTTVCETHGTLVSHETRKAAEESLSHPDWWCDDCRGYNEMGPLTRNAERVPADLKRLLPQLAAVAQEQYDAWQQDEEGIDEEVGSGGICHLIADRHTEVLSLAGIECTTVSSMHEVHVYAVAALPSGVWLVDIRPHVYERGGGYTWTKIPGVRFDESDVTIERLSPDPGDFAEYVGE